MIGWSQYKNNGNWVLRVRSRGREEIVGAIFRFWDNTWHWNISPFWAPEARSAYRRSRGGLSSPFLSGDARSMQEAKKEVEDTIEFLGGLED